MAAKDHTLYQFAMTVSRSTQKIRWKAIDQDFAHVGSCEGYCYFLINSTLTLAPAQSAWIHLWIF